MTILMDTLHEDVYIYGNISLNSCDNGKCFKQGCRQTQNTY